MGQNPLKIFNEYAASGRRWPGKSKRAGNLLAFSGGERECALFN
jgi:hypothetical protein